MSEAEEIKIEEDIAEEEEKQKEASYTEEFRVKGEELLGTVKSLAQEAGVRRIVIQNKQGRVLVEIPLLLGLAGIALLPYWAAIALIAALVTDCSIVVERAEKASGEAEAE